MSIPVELDALQAKTEEYGWAYLLTVNDDQTPKIVAITPEWEGGALVADVGGGSVRNASVRPSVTLTYPPLDPADYTLIVDGDAEPIAAPDGDRDAPANGLRFVPRGAVLHRPAPAGFTGSATGCSHDCAPVESPA